MFKIVKYFKMKKLKKDVIYYPPIEDIVAVQPMKKPSPDNMWVIEHP